MSQIKGYFDNYDCDCIMYDELHKVCIFDRMEKIEPPAPIAGYPWVKEDEQNV